MRSQSILIIDDEAQIRKMLTITLHSSGYEVNEAATGKDGVKMVSAVPPDLVLLDLGLPDVSGHEVLKHLREWFSNPVIVISVLRDEQNIINALDNGANDYLVKPFRTDELLARIKSALKKAVSEPNRPRVNFNNLTIDFANRIVMKDNAPLKLNATEYALLSLLAQNDGKVLTHQYLLNKIWGPSHEEESQNLKVFIAQLRKKIETDPNRPSYILTESGIGYRFRGSSSQ
ncbi:MAG TPA: response regulator transcription factor [Chryseolinea sp.]